MVGLRDATEQNIRNAQTNSIRTSAIAVAAFSKMKHEITHPANEK